MEYIVHVVDMASQHRKKEGYGSFEVLEGKAENGETGEIVCSDHFYLIEDENPVDAVVSVANLIRVKDVDDETASIADMFQKAQSKNASIDDDSFISPQVSNVETVDNTHSELMKSSFHIERNDGEGKWLELHEVFFYVVPRNEMIYVKS